jgi:hypothetical protein
VTIPLMGLPQVTITYRQIMYQVFSAVVHMQNYNVIHRDLKVVTIMRTCFD